MAVYIRWAEKNEIKEEIIGHEILDDRVTGKNVFNKLKKILSDYGLSFDNLVGLTTDGSANMVGIHKGLHGFVKKEAPNCILLHCMIHRNVLATNIRPPLFEEILRKVVLIINKIKNNFLNSMLFKSLCNTEDENFSSLLYFTPIRWLSKGQMISRFNVLISSIALFF